ncbi:hypothetical protein KC19_VG332200 [Ceratodon purpureus]|uniref:Uncharacterized protein n=1 Tax=Ceratodon purpureus TaxID=3225 RepID=A0A8T0HX72_CERPU|nr:hypothetical protein KC19_VG332200 [Ceratodon purpureus]
MIRRAAASEFNIYLLLTCTERSERMRMRKELVQYDVPVVPAAERSNMKRTPGSQQASKRSGRRNRYVGIAATPTQNNTGCGGMRRNYMSSRGGTEQQQLDKMSSTIDRCLTSRVARDGGRGMEDGRSR